MRSDRAEDHPDEVRIPLTRKCLNGWLTFRANDAVIGRCLYYCSHFSPGEVRLFQTLVNPGDVVVEAGAYIGCFTVPLARFVDRRGAVHAFEPNPDSYQLLQRNLALNDSQNVTAYAAALGECEGEQSITIPDVDQPGNFGDVALTACDKGHPVNVTTIDSLRLSRCDFIKADVQGMEREVLLGASETLARCRPILYLENDIWQKSEPLLATIVALGYESWWHLPPVCESESRDLPEDVARLRDCVSVNLLSFPVESETRVANLRKVTGVTDWWRPDC